LGDQGGYGTIFKLDAAGNETVLHFFTGGEAGFDPRGGVVQDARGNLYGVTRNGGIDSCNRGCGTVFQLAPDGTFTTLHRFSGDSSEGVHPETNLVLDDAGSLYGTTNVGGAGGLDGYGTVFRIDSAGVFTTLHHFAESSLYEPGGPLMRDDAGNLYGVTVCCGSENGGVIFKLDPAGQLNNLHEFRISSVYDGWQYSRARGGTAPYAGLVGDPAGIVYGTTMTGGESARGIVYRFDMQSHAFDVLHTFTTAQGGWIRVPLARDSAGTLYGTTSRGGDPTCNCGTVFKVSE
jgi:uncharacterized repeat protein (TIGR03803 family)